MTSYEKQLIPHYEEIKLEFKEALEDHNAGKIPSTMKHEFGGQKSGKNTNDESVTGKDNGESSAD